MPIYLRQSTASQEVPLGFFVDSTDGNTEETGLTIANTDIWIWKTGGTTFGNKASGGATHVQNGLYYATLDATDTNTIGPLVIFVHKSGALAVRVECCVLDEAVYDALFGTVALSTYAGGDTSGVTTLLGRVVGTVAAGTHNPQSGDSYPLVSTEVAEIYAAVITNAAGTDVAADIIAIKGVVDVIQADTDLLDDAAGGIADIHSDVAAVKTQLDVIQADTDLLDDVAGGLADIHTDVGTTITQTVGTTMADAILDRNMATGADSGGRTVRNALRALRNKASITGATLTVTKEDDTTAAWTAAVTTDAAADPITAIDPA